MIKLENLAEIQVLLPADLELPGPEDPDVVVDDGVLVAGGLQAELDSPLLLKTCWNVCKNVP